jgi:hypothetical protein
MTRQFHQVALAGRHPGPFADAPITGLGPAGRQAACPPLQDGDPVRVGRYRPESCTETSSLPT